MSAAEDHMNTSKSFQEIILRLQTYWAEQGCAILQPYDMEVGAGTFHPATTLRAWGSKPVPYTHLTLPTNRIQY